jgi:hypothetical protein
MISKASERLDGTHCRWGVQYGAKSFLRWLEQRMIAAAPIVLEHVDEPQADGGNSDGSHTDAGQDGDGCADDAGELADGCVDDEAAGNNT